MPDKLIPLCKLYENVSRTTGREGAGRIIPPLALLLKRAVDVLRSGKRTQYRGIGLRVHLTR